MTKLRKQRRRKTFAHNVNRRRLRDKIYSVGKIKCKEIDDEWDIQKSVRGNLKEMGLAYDPNQAIGSINKNKDLPHSVWKQKKVSEDITPSKSFVADKLYEDAKRPRPKGLKLPQGEVEYISYLLDTYGNNYKAMVKDKRNYNQETWRQFRRKIKLFKSITDQYTEYLKSRGLSNIILDEPSESDDDI